ncbi:MAG: hypothetical protein VKJ04_04280 [Vampirovibrionales bacterium]|nr:hypothetical protein [Vampirovibrionales bacterium]
MYNLEELYELVKAKKHRQAHQWIWSIFNTYVQYNKTDKLAQLLKNIDLNKLSFHEIYCLMCAGKLLQNESVHAKIQFTYASFFTKAKSELTRRIGVKRSAWIIKLYHST